jgi:hypothetical protein
MNTKKEIDWEQRRYELVKELCRQDSGFKHLDVTAKQIWARNVIQCADAIIEELKK